MSNTREIATQILTDIYRNYEFFENSISNNKKYNRLDLRDKAFVKFLIYNTLRRNGQVEKVINTLVRKPIRKNDLFIQNLVRISICQILFLDIKDYSIVNTAVEIAKHYKLDKFVNGLLRNVCRNKEKISKSLRLECNIPSWINNDIKKNLGKYTLINISKTIIKEPFLDIKIKSNYLEKKDWSKILDGKFIFKDIVRVKNEGKIENKPNYKDGIWWVQSFSSTLPVRIISEIFKEENKKTVSILDVGAAPGGKTFQLIEQGFNVTSIEISKKRIERFDDNSKRLNYKTNLINNDYIKFKSKKLYDCILIDAPCTASGLIQKKPEILIKDKKLDLKRLEIKQQKMLYNSIKKIRPGGFILYCVCSIISDEGINQINKFMKENKNFETIPLTDEISSFGKTLKKGSLLIIPDERRIIGGIDGFFISLMKKK